MTLQEEFRDKYIAALKLIEERNPGEKIEIPDFAFSGKNFMQGRSAGLTERCTKLKNGDKIVGAIDQICGRILFEFRQIIGWEFSYERIKGNPNIREIKREFHMSCTVDNRNHAVQINNDSDAMIVKDFEKVLIRENIFSNTLFHLKLLMCGIQISQVHVDVTNDTASYSLFVEFS